jgi:hypothetical protein
MCTVVTWVHTHTAFGRIGQRSAMTSAKLNSVMEKRAKTKAEPPAAQRTHQTTGINLPLELWSLLNRVAFNRALKRGGRPSVSAILVELIEKHRKKLEEELEG